ncbi:TusE/DsrC/DsvC family sulfur relay protein [Blochmannia endosymbiont of Polyrhachis (Hedomyrma) turneri]|uniref:TusE/DsrC/DsvC family sulfur relay protein n=1 Tax=Blochmannia endosymbiont of Polyrhachis (Hedomyrma) turneri TaxID=1505596 RepID=UPI00061A67C4|nr:TusE/DsrC/DsvC family sulfur relay protein [Blochmannia endosymbiont of Polyrhachis (Hedomyrma) turneri]AKC59978.1 Sulfurtransferase TusE [Blochmannia endosymbiont of Polyrhachis (Hedomyrma) turneri]
MNKQTLKLITDSEGYLLNFNDWNEEIATLIANNDKILLKNPHWEIIYFVRSFYTKFNISPNIRLLVKKLALKYGPNKGNSIYLLRLFQNNEIAREIAKISGLPKPKKCL